MSENAPKSRAERVAFLVGLCLQGLILGVLLTLALLQMWAEVDGVRLFRYQNF